MKSTGAIALAAMLLVTACTPEAGSDTTTTFEVDPGTPGTGDTSTSVSSPGAGPDTTGDTAQPTGSSTDTDATTDGSPATATTTIPSPSATGDQLVVGALLPVTGGQSAFGPAMTAAARVAVDDINAGGGVFGSDVTIVEADGGDSSLGLAGDAVEGLLAEDVDVIIGALTSSVSELVIDAITGAGVIQFSPSNTSPVFTDYPDDGLYFRTAASDTLEGRILAQLLANEGALPTAVVYRDDTYGQAVSEEFEANFSALGGEVSATLAYDPGDDASSIVAGIDTSAPVVVVIGLDETADIVSAMASTGVGPADRSVWVLEPAFESLGGLVDDPSVLAGLRGLARGSQIESQSALYAAMDAAWGAPIDIYAYGPETYDAVIITALAALVAGEDDPVAIAAEINDVTRFGEVCSTFSECASLIDAGMDIDYDGQGGTYQFSDLGEPTTATYRVVTYTGDAEPEIGDVIQAL